MIYTPIHASISIWYSTILSSFPPLNVQKKSVVVGLKEEAGQEIEKSTRISLMVKETFFIIRVQTFIIT